MRPNLITRLKEEWNNLDPVDPLRGLIADAIDALAEQPAQELLAWKNAAIRVGEELASVGPNGYYNMTADQWLAWAMDQQPRGKNSLAEQPAPHRHISYVCPQCYWSLDEQPAQQQEPVAWMVYTLDGNSVCVTDNPADFTPDHRALPLYTSPQPASKPEDK